MTRVLLADADLVFASGIQRVLEKRGFAVDAVGDGRLALNGLQLNLADVCLLGADLMVMDGLSVLRRARAMGAPMPVMVLASADTAAARLTWLDAGADDIVNRPFDIDEVVARLRSMHRRREDRADAALLRCGPLSFDILSGSFLLHDGLFVLTPKEHAFLRALMSRPGFMVPKDRVFRAVFGDAAGPGAIDVLACRVRRKLLGCGVALRTVRGHGYILEQDLGSQDPQALQAQAQKYTRSASSAPLPLRSVATAPDAA